MGELKDAITSFFKKAQKGRHQPPKDEGARLSKNLRANSKTKNKMQKQISVFSTQKIRDLVVKIFASPSKDVWMRPLSSPPKDELFEI